MRFGVLSLFVACACLQGQSWQDKFKLGAELRGRIESNNDEGYHLHRVRLNLQIDALPWLRFVGQAQDARALANDRIPDAPPFRDAIDLRLGYVELSESGKGLFGLRVGRQEINIGDQRLVGSSNWGNAARSFDAVRATWRPTKGYALHAFAASVVNLRQHHFNDHTGGNYLHGAYAIMDDVVAGGVVEPYFLWRDSRGINFRTFGARATGKLAKQLDYRVEMAVQEGRIAGDSMQAWAGHWVIGYTVRKTRWIAEYNHASGDDDPDDHRQNTFTLLYPTPHDKYGLADRVGWRNIHHNRFGVEYKPRDKWTFISNYHTWWLASTNDGLYSAPGTLIAKLPGAPRHVGQEIDIQGFYVHSKQVRIGAGYGHVFPGGFLNAALPGKSLHFSYVMVTWIL